MRRGFAPRGARRDQPTGQRSAAALEPQAHPLAFPIRPPQRALAASAWRLTIDSRASLPDRLGTRGREVARSGKSERSGEGLPRSSWRAVAEAHVYLAVRGATINPPVSFHALRHTWASLAAMNGTPLFVVAKNLGHADARMVERHYGHLAPSYIADAIRAGAPKFGFKPGKAVL